MTKACPDWKEQLLEAALGAQPAAVFATHLHDCRQCAAALRELRRRSEELDRLLVLVAQGVEPPPDFRARVLSAVERGQRVLPLWRRWAIAGLAAAGVLIAFWATHVRNLRRDEVRLFPAEKITQWRAPSDVFLETPGRQNLRTAPRLSESVVNFVVTKNEEE